MTAFNHRHVYNSDFQRKGTVIAASGTALIWLLLCAAGIFFPLLRRPPEYRTIRITLAAQPAVRQIPEVPPSAESQPVSQTRSAASRPVSGETRTPPAVREQPAAGTASRKQLPLVKSVEQLMAEQSASKSAGPAQWNDRVFSENAEVYASAPAAASPDARPVSPGEALSGKAAAVTAAATGAAGENTTSRRNTAANSVAASTASALGKITAAEYTHVSGSGISSSAVIGTAESSDGRLAIEMSDGSARVLLDPATPVIVISDENARLIDSSRTVTITFHVLPGGNVLLTGVEIVPASSLPLILQSEIKKQISAWRFAPDKNEGIARFEYSIIKK